MKYNAAFSPAFNTEPLNGLVAYDEPVSLTEMKDHLRISNDTENLWLQSAGKAARLRLEACTGQFFKPRNITVVFKNELGGFTLPYLPNGAVTYVDINAVAITGYDADLEYDDAITATYNAGYGFAASPVPEDVKQAILAQVAFLYVNRGDANTMGRMSDIAKDLVSDYKRMSV